MSNLAISLWITLIGVLLIFAAILILWGLMELLVRVTSPKNNTKAVEIAEEEMQDTLQFSAVSDRKRLAAAAAVAAALAFQRSSASLSAPPKSSELSAWQVAQMQNNR